MRKSTDIAFAADDVGLSRAEVEQMLCACVAAVEEGLAGKSRDVRNMFLDALPEVARTTTWDMTLRTGLPCWGAVLMKR